MVIRMKSPSDIEALHKSGSIGLNEFTNRAWSLLEVLG
jgi:hypothetical protein